MVDLDCYRLLEGKQKTYTAVNSSEKYHKRRVKYPGKNA
jgi:hypothetical protein